MWNHKNHSATPIIFHFQTLAKFNDCSSCREYSEQYCLETAKFHWKLTAGVKWALLTYTDFHFLCQCRACIMLKSSWHRQNFNAPVKFFCRHPPWQPRGQRKYACDKKGRGTKKNGWFWWLYRAGKVKIKVIRTPGQQQKSDVPGGVRGGADGVRTIWPVHKHLDSQFIC